MPLVGIPVQGRLYAGPRICRGAPIWEHQGCKNDKSLNLALVAIMVNVVADPEVEEATPMNDALRYHTDQVKLVAVSGLFAALVQRYAVIFRQCRNEDMFR